MWYLIWETILNILAELTYFADRSFYGPWWNSGKSLVPIHPLLHHRKGASVHAAQANAASSSR